MFSTKDHRKNEIRNFRQQKNKHFDVESFDFYRSQKQCGIKTAGTFGVAPQRQNVKPPSGSSIADLALV
jgi:hypothetical protein